MPSRAALAFTRMRGRRLSVETALMGAAAAILALLSLRAGPWWSRGVVGTGMRGTTSGTSTTWSARSAARSRSVLPARLRPGGGEPEGPHALARELRARRVPRPARGPLHGLQHDGPLLVVLAAGSSYRLARRLGASPGAALGALVFAFAPQRMARTLGHLNLLSIGWLPAALEGLLVASRTSGLRRVAGVLAGALGLVLLAYSDWYLALMGALAAISFAAFEIARANRERRAGTAAALSAAGLLALAAVLPAARALGRETAGHARTRRPRCRRLRDVLLLFLRRSRSSPVSPPRSRRARARRPRRPGTISASSRSRLFSRPRSAADGSGSSHFALAAGGAALLLSMGPALRLFGSPTSVPLPYALLERLVPLVRLGGAVNRFQALRLSPDRPRCRVRGHAASRGRAADARRRRSAPRVRRVRARGSRPLRVAVRTAGSRDGRDLGLGGAGRRPRHRPGEPGHDPPAPARTAAGPRSPFAHARAGPGQLGGSGTR